MNTSPPHTERLDAHLEYLKLIFFREHYQALAAEAAAAHWNSVDYLAALSEGEALRRQERTAATGGWAEPWGTLGETRFTRLGAAV